MASGVQGVIFFQFFDVASLLAFQEGFIIKWQHDFITCLNRKKRISKENATRLKSKTKCGEIFSKRKLKFSNLF